MKRGGDESNEQLGNTTMQIATVVLPLTFALWAALFTGQYELPLIFSVGWAILCFIHLFYFAHVKRSDIHDLTVGHEEALLQHNRTTAIINNLADAIIATDEHGIVTLSNAASMSLLDTNTALIGKKIDTVVRLFTGPNTPLSLHTLLQKTKTTELRDDVMLKQGEDTLRLNLVYAPIRGSDSLGKYAQKGFIVIMRDITRQKSLEEERDEFISVVSHELRTPITIAEGALSNLQFMNEQGKASSDQLTSGITMAHEQVLFLAGMINDLSTLSRAERGVMAEKSVIAIEPFIHSLFNQYSKEAAKKKLHFNLDMDPQIGSVEASELYLHELIQNFITNAIKYTRQGSITLRVHKIGDSIEFAVKDSGIGISKSDQKRVFEKFFRSEDYRTRETSGTGLGLYVAKKLSHLMGTQIQLESRLNHGSTFSFTLPSKK